MSNVNMSRGLPETVLPPAPTDLEQQLQSALAMDGEERRSAIGDVVRRSPTYLAAWAELGDIGRDDIERYAAYRVGYHRGLDQLRQNGWRGSGFVRWSQPSNRGFLRSLDGLRRAAAAIGELDEADRCRTFLSQLDPEMPVGD